MSLPIPDATLEQCLTLLAEGKDLTQIAGEVGHARPSLSVRLHKPEWEERYEQAVREGIEANLDKAFQAATEAKDTFEVQKARAIADNAKWYASKRHAQVFGDKIQSDLTEPLQIFLGIKRKVAITDESIVSTQ